MAKYINSDKFRRKLLNYSDGYGTIHIPITKLNIAMEKSSADVRKNKHGEWQSGYDEGYYDGLVVSLNLLRKLIEKHKK